MPDRRRLATRWVCLACVAVGILNGAVWAFLQPPFQGPDEPAHFSYAQFIAKTGHLKPIRDDPGLRNGYALHTELLLDYLPFSVEGPVNWSPRQAHQLEELVEHTPNKAGNGRGAAFGTPPLYYLMQAPLVAASWNWNPKSSLVLSRLLSALLNGVTVALIFGFLMELIPTRPWTWTLGALAVALHPVFGFMGGTVNPDALLFSFSAALFLLAARVLRRGLTVRLGLLIGLVATLGCLTKGTTYGLLPGVGAAALVGALRLHRRTGNWRQPLLGLGSGAGVFVLGFGGYLWANSHLLNKSPATAGAFVTSKSAASATTVTGQLEYIWQFFLPRLWDMTDQFPGYPSYPLWDFYVKGFVGRFGWWQYDFPHWTQWLGLGVLCLLLAAAAAALVPRLLARPRLRTELAIYFVIAASVLLLVSVAGYRFTAVNHLDFEQTRYIFPLLPLYGALVATAPLVLRRRWAPVAGGVLLVLLALHSFAADLLTLQRYYT